MDRRIQRTQLSLHQSLIALILEKGYDPITVKDITQRANVGRSTFYAHYLDKEDLLQKGLDDLGKVLSTERDALRRRLGGDSRFAFSLAFFRHAHNYRAVYKAMVDQHAGALVSKRLQMVLAGLVRDELGTLKTGTVSDVIPKEVLVLFVVGAIMSVLTWWLDDADQASAEHVEALFRQLTAPVFVL